MTVVIPDYRFIRPPRFGAHISIAGGLPKAARRAVDTGCECMAVFSASPRIWKRDIPSPHDIDRFRKIIEYADISPVIVHAPYLVNIATPDDSLFHRSIEVLAFEMEFARLIGSPIVVTHPGSHSGRGKNFGYARCTTALEHIFSRFHNDTVGIALELTEGAGTQICSSFEDASSIMNLAEMEERLTICIDTCHLFSAGYDIRSLDTWNTTVSRIESMIALSAITVIHLNDSLGYLGSHIDRHTHIGEGEVGIDGFRAIINDPRMNDKPMIIETPKGLDNTKDKANLRMLRSLMNEIVETND